MLALGTFRFKAGGNFLPIEKLSILHRGKVGGSAERGSGQSGLGQPRGREKVINRLHTGVLGVCIWLCYKCRGSAIVLRAKVASSTCLGGVVEGVSDTFSQRRVSEK